MYKDTLRATHARTPTTTIIDRLAILVCVPNDDESTEFVRHIINVTADRFSAGAVSVDRSVFNPARIWKLYETFARKGDEVPKLGRVHRRACVLSKGFEE